MPAKKDEERGGESREDLVSYTQAQKYIKLEAVDCQMLQKGQEGREGKMAPGYDITGEVSWHPGGLRSSEQALSCLLAVFGASSLRK